MSRCKAKLMGAPPPEPGYVNGHWCGGEPGHTGDHGCIVGGCPVTWPQEEGEGL